MNLKSALYECLPAGHYGIIGMLRLLDVVETTAVPTAAVECSAQPRLLVNPEFVARHAATPERLMMLVMHEMHHILLGHTRTLPTSSAHDNFVFDAVINAMLCRMFPQPEYTSLFTALYSDRAFPECLLRPPERWHPDVKAELPPSLRKSARADIAGVYRALYSTEGASYAEVRALLGLLDDASVADVALLGAHEEDRHSATGPLARAVADIVRKWPAPPQPLRGRSLDGILREAGLVPCREPDNRTLLRGLILRVADRQGRLRMGGRSSTPGQTPIGRPDRRCVVGQSLGFAPLLTTAELPDRRRVEGGSKVHVYIDVSGSMDVVLPAVYGAVLDCADWVHPSVHLFSTEIVECPLRRLKSGWSQGTGGTDIACVARHMAERRVHRAVVITDGYVGRAAHEDAAVLRRVRMGVAYAGPADTRMLDPFADAKVLLRAPGGAAR